MKTIEEKARAYDEALEKAKEILEMTSDKSAIYTIFPELAESSDEKIRKEIVRFIQMEVEDEIVGNKWLAWLERQGDYANFRNKAQVGDRITKNEDGVLVNLSQLKRVAKPSEKQGEQKPNENKENIGGISANSKWGEEDKGIIEEVVSYLINYSNIVESKEDADRIEYLIDKIQDICPHQKQEWSEEDEEHIDSLLKRLDALCRNKFERTRFAISEDREWLKSLRPQNRWKPSDEQIKVCKEVYADLLSAKGFDLGTVVSELNRLEEGLKKKGE